MLQVCIKDFIRHFCNYEHMQMFVTFSVQMHAFAIVIYIERETYFSILNTYMYWLNYYSQIFCFFIIYISRSFIQKLEVKKWLNCKHIKFLVIGIYIGERKTRSLFSRLSEISNSIFKSCFGLRVSIKYIVMFFFQEPFSLLAIWFLKTSFDASGVSL